MDTDTRQLTSAIASGDPEAFTRFYEERFDGMLAMARQATGRDESFCMDVVQDAMLRVIRRLPIIDEEPALSAWIRRVVLSAAYDRLRAEHRRARRELRVARDRAPSADAGATDDERLAWLRERIAELEPEAASLIRLRFGLGWTLARIGESLGLKPGAVDGRIGRVAKGIREQVEEGEL